MKMKCNHVDKELCVCNDKETMLWKKYPQEKPNDFFACYVTNLKRGHHSWLAFYHKDYDYFSIIDPRYQGLPLEVTHFIELPDLPSDKDEK